MLFTEDPAVDLATPAGAMRTYLYRPVAPAGIPAGRTRFPGVVLYSEIYQRTGPIHRLAMISAGHGFLVAVPEVFHELEAPGTVLAYDKLGTDRGNANKIGKPVDGASLAPSFDEPANGRSRHRVRCSTIGRWAGGFSSDSSLRASPPPRLQAMRARPASHAACRAGSIRA